MQLPGSIPGPTPQRALPEHWVRQSPEHQPIRVWCLKKEKKRAGKHFIHKNGDGNLHPKTVGIVKGGTSLISPSKGSVSIG